MALAQPAQAKIVHTHTYQAFGSSGLTLDLNHDGIADFKLKSLRLASRTQLVLAYSLRSNRMFGGEASCLPAGYRIGPNRQRFQKGAFFSSHQSWPAKYLSEFKGVSTSSTHRGPWSKTKWGYLGFKFFIKGKIHYGWARVSHVLKSTNWHLVGYAYETIPDKPIIAGQTKGRDASGGGAPDAALINPTPKAATLGALAMGSSGLSIWRREVAKSVR
jgi:hypothetical protein